LLCFQFSAGYFAAAEAAEVVVWDSCLACSSAVAEAAEVSVVVGSAAGVLGAAAEDSADLAEAALGEAARAAVGRRRRTE
jgi:hypothetical protein